MIVRLADKSDLNQIMEIIADAKRLLRNSGSKQWNTDSYPNEDTMMNDINNNSLYVVENNGLLLGIVSLIYGNDENYDVIEGSWLTNTQEYLTLHRIAVRDGFYHTGVTTLLMNKAIELAKELKTTIKADTHKLNLPMQKLLIKTGFKYCGTINLVRTKVDSFRLAYELKL